VIFKLGGATALPQIPLLFLTGWLCGSEEKRGKREEGSTPYEKFLDLLLGMTTCHSVTPYEKFLDLLLGMTTCHSVTSVRTKAVLTW